MKKRALILLLLLLSLFSGAARPADNREAKMNELESWFRKHYNPEFPYYGTGAFEVDRQHRFSPYHIIPQWDLMTQDQEGALKTWLVPVIPERNVLVRFRIAPETFDTAMRYQFVQFYLVVQERGLRKDAVLRFSLQDPREEKKGNRLVVDVDPDTGGTLFISYYENGELAGFYDEKFYDNTSRNAVDHPLDLLNDVGGHLFTQSRFDGYLTVHPSLAATNYVKLLNARAKTHSVGMSKLSVRVTDRVNPAFTALVAAE
ncbi:MAG: hypothetical protein IJV01_02640 [Bacteroidales bacterium]|nr:hypothetical protein [Bacteroidales bacterium]